MCELSDLKRVELDLLAEFARVCEREGLIWYAIFGTLLGAVRHGGFIPWDDDIDVAMPRSDYDKLRESPGLFREPYVLQTPRNDKAAATGFMRLRKSGTTALSNNFPNIMTRGGHLGIRIDILPLDDAPTDKALRKLNRLANKIHRQMLCSAALDENEGSDVPEFKKILCYKGGGIAGCYDILAERYEYVCSMYKDERFCAIPALAGKRGRIKFKKTWFEHRVELDFEGMKVYAPSGWRDFLEACYPDGTDETDIDEEQREKQHFWFTDIHTDYTEYLLRYSGMLNGIGGKRILLFGAGDSLRIWLERYQLRDQVICTFDNSPKKWGTQAYGIPVKAPKELPLLLGEDSRVIITSLYHREIGKQLEKMGIYCYYVFIDGWNY